jgi:hypothetical protein
MPGHWLRDAGIWITVPIVASAVSNKHASAGFQFAGPNPSASSKRKLGDSPNTWDLTAGQIRMEIAEILL